MFVAEVSRQTITRAWQGNVFLLVMVGLAENDMAMSSCTAQNGGATVIPGGNKLGLSYIVSTSMHIIFRIFLCFFIITHLSEIMHKCICASVVDPDPYWIRIQELSGS